MHLVQVCDRLTKQVRWVNIMNQPSWGTDVSVLKAHDWAAIARIDACIEANDKLLGWDTPLAEAYGG